MVANQKPAPVIVYDYYDSSRQARAFYEIPQSTVCDICEDAECKKTCSEKKSVSGNQRSSPTVSEEIEKPKDQSSTFKPSFTAIIALTLALLLRP